MADDAQKLENEKRKEAQNLEKNAPKFVLGEMPWATFMDNFQEVQTRYPLVDPTKAKSILYTSLKGQAFALASPDYNPRTNSAYITLSFEDYATKVGELFEPAAEAEQTKLEFEERYQRSGEHPNLYFRDKKNLFYRAYAATMRDWNFFYNKVIAGLINQEMKNGMRLFNPEPISNHESFRTRLMQMATIVRRRYLEGEITEAEALGAEAHASIASYRSAGSQELSLGGAPKIKAEPINALGGATTQGKRPGRCYYCLGKDHFIAQCPRKAAGLAPTVQYVEPTQEETINMLRTGQRRTYFDAKTGSKFRHQEGGRNRYNSKPNGSNGNNGNRFNRRIAVVYENEEGTTIAEDSELYETTEEEDIKPPATEPVEDGVNALHLEQQGKEDFTETGFVPGSFLGM